MRNKTMNGEIKEEKRGNTRGNGSIAEISENQIINK